MKIIISVLVLAVLGAFYFYIQGTTKGCEDVGHDGSKISLLFERYCLKKYSASHILVPYNDRFLYAEGKNEE